MLEHAVLLEQYARMFEETQKRTNIFNEFKTIMQQGGKFPQEQINEYLSVKVRGMQAHELGNLMRGSNAPPANPRSQS